ncbi:MAG: alpha/beta hydrolase domain-containing protein, partial [Blastocatellia bacterium]
MALLRFHRFACVLIAAAVVFGCSINAEARVTKILIERKQSPSNEGKSFGTVGQYEMLTGKAFGELDPKGPHNAIITDIQFAQRNARGMVE